VITVVVVVDNLLVNADFATDSCSCWQANVIVAVQVHTKSAGNQKPNALNSTMAQ